MNFWKFYTLECTQKFIRTGLLFFCPSNAIAKKLWSMVSANPTFALNGIQDVELFRIVRNLYYLLRFYENSNVTKVGTLSVYLFLVKDVKIFKRFGCPSVLDLYRLKSLPTPPLPRGTTRHDKRGGDPLFSTVGVHNHAFLTSAAFRNLRCNNGIDRNSIHLLS